MEWIVLLIVVIAAWVGRAGLSRRLRRVESDLALIRQRLDALDGAAVAAPVPAPASTPAPIPAPVPPTATLEEPPAAPVEAEAAGPLQPDREIPDGTPGPWGPPPGKRLEEQLTGRWLVWLGGATLALGGSFLAKYSIDQGWLGPAIRVVLGLLVGLAMVAVSEWLMQRRDARFAAVQASYVPAALAAAGAVTLYATLFAAFWLLEMISALLAFGGLAAVSALTVLLALRHGPFMALLGLVGAFAVPAIVTTEQPSTIGLLLYLALVVAGALAIGRARAWWWLGWAALAGSVLWLLLRLFLPVDTLDAIAIGLFAVLLIGLFVGFRDGVRRIAWLAPGDAPSADATLQLHGAAGAVMVVLLALVQATGNADVPLALVLIVGALLLALGRRDPTLDLLPAIGGAAALLLLSGWPPPTVDWIERTPLALPDRFAVTALATALLYGVGGFAALWGAARPGRFAALSVVAPLAALTIAYLRFTWLDVDVAWTPAALGLAALALVAAHRLTPWRDDDGLRAALAAYAAATVAALALAATMALREAWLTVALSLLLPGLGWIHDRLRVPELRWVALAAAAVVLVRLVFNPAVLGYESPASLVFSWVIYGYGVPALAFGTAVRLFRRERDDLLTAVLEAGTIAFAVLLATFLIRQGFNDGAIARAEYGPAERALQTLSWLGFGTALLFGAAGRASPVWLWAGRVLCWGAGAHAAVVLLGKNPLVSGEAVGTWPLLDLLLLAYAAPAVLFGALWLAAARVRDVPLRIAAGAAAVLFALAHVSLEIRHLFHGSVLRGGEVGEAELYCYSAAWLMIAGALIAAGIRFATPALRHAGLALTLLTVAKVFIVDMAGLQGLLRALSFLGLGVVLVGIGYLYRRYLALLNPSPSR